MGSFQYRQALSRPLLATKYPSTSLFSNDAS
jgi:hypothetical protein